VYLWLLPSRGDEALVSATRPEFQYGYRISIFREYVTLAVLESGACKDAYQNFTMTIHFRLRSWIRIRGYKGPTSSIFMALCVIYN
jgi:hypothetical protein